jgi:hypothetical protein
MERKLTQHGLWPSSGTWARCIQSLRGRFADLPLRDRLATNPTRQETYKVVESFPVSHSASSVSDKTADVIPGHLVAEKHGPACLMVRTRTPWRDVPSTLTALSGKIELSYHDRYHWGSLLTDSCLTRILGRRRLKLPSAKAVSTLTWAETGTAETMRTSPVELNPNLQQLIVCQTALIGAPL